jgi:hypothetical protein
VVRPQRGQRSFTGLPAPGRPRVKMLPPGDSTMTHSQPSSATASGRVRRGKLSFPSISMELIIDTSGVYWKSCPETTVHPQAFLACCWGLH